MGSKTNSSDETTEALVSPHSFCTLVWRDSSVQRKFPRAEIFVTAIKRVGKGTLMIMFIAFFLVYLIAAY